MGKRSFKPNFTPSSLVLRTRKVTGIELGEKRLGQPGTPKSVLLQSGGKSGGRSSE